MAELAIGTIGLVPLYSFAHEFFGDVQFARNCRDDFDRYQTKLDLVDAKLTRWASSVGLGQPTTLQSEIARISELVTESDGESQTVKGTLTQIVRTFEKCKKKAKPYTAICDPDVDLRPGFQVTHRVLNSICCRRAPQSATEHTEWEPGLLKRAKWALHDKDRIGSLISDLRDLVDQLVDLFPPSDPQRFAALAQEEVNDLHSNLSNAQIDDAERRQALESVSEIASETDEVLAGLLADLTLQGRTVYRLRDYVYTDRTTAVHGDIINDNALGKARPEGGRFYDSAKGRHEGDSLAVYGHMHGSHKRGND